MKTPVILAAAAAVAVAALPTRADAESAYSTAPVDLRAGPGAEYPVVNQLDSNFDVEIYACLEGRTWCDVGAPAAGRGWVAGRYLAYSSDGVIVDQSPADIPVTTYETGTYWDSHYADRDFYTERDRFMDRDGGVAAATTTTTTTENTGGALTGAATGAAAGAIVGGPVGAVVGGAVGAMAGTAIDPPRTVQTYVTQNRVDPVTVEGRVAVGTALPNQVVLHPVPQYEYDYTYVNGQPVLVDPASRQIVYVYQ